MEREYGMSNTFNAICQYYYYLVFVHKKFTALLTATILNVSLLNQLIYKSF